MDQDTEDMGAGATSRFSRQSKPLTNIADDRYPNHGLLTTTDVEPHDSISNVSSVSDRHTTSTSSRRVRAMIAFEKELQLAASLVSMKKQHELKIQQEIIERQMEREEFEARIRKRDLEAKRAEIDFQKEQLTLECELETAQTISRACSEASILNTAGSYQRLPVVSGTMATQSGEWRQRPPATTSTPVVSSTMATQSAEWRQRLPATTSTAAAVSGPMAPQAQYRWGQPVLATTTTAAALSGPMVTQAEYRWGQPVPVTTSTAAAVSGAKAPQSEDTGNQHPETTMSDILTSLVNLQRNAQLPRRDLDTFDGGNVLEFPAFLKTFRWMVEDGTDDKKRLELLLKYTRGEAKELIKDCIFFESASDAYETAIKLLKESYGHPALLGAKYRQKAETWPQIRSGDGEALRKFAIFLTGFLNFRKGSVDIQIADGYEFLRMLASKLPVALQNHWVKIVGRCRDEQMRAPKFDDLVGFVQKQSRDMNDPRIAGLGYQRRNESEKGQGGRHRQQTET